LSSFEKNEHKASAESPTWFWMLSA